MAKSIKGKAKADENPSIPIIGAIPPLEADSTKRVPTIGPVQENDTNAKVNAIKKIPKDTRQKPLDEIDLAKSTKKDYLN
jgi:hypothetical protein